jgi:hypothetical protein
MQLRLVERVEDISPEDFKKNLRLANTTLSADWQKNGQLIPNGIGISL